MAALRALPPVQDTLELACGTGIWTQQLLSITQTVTAIDASPEMIALSGKRRVEYSNPT
jgi:ubiquinone/menaquinone biosynthesis C-methylase UbiE